MGWPRGQNFSLDLDFLNAHTEASHHLGRLDATHGEHQEIMEKSSTDIAAVKNPR